ncbi:hypothetical protein E4U21_006852 [Claviceps maximensis]|nr:hypothetical protein E4U21_006852 [Claviceps maximensis]
MPEDPLELERVWMFGFGAIPNLEASLASDVPLKRRLRPRRSNSNEIAKDAVDSVSVEVTSRQRQKSLSWQPTKKAKLTSSSARQRISK